MSIEWFRDLVIVIFGIAATLAVILVVILAFILYNRLKPIVKSVEKTTGTIQKIVSDVEEAVAGPLAQIISFIQGIRSAMGMVKKFTKREED